MTPQTKALVERLQKRIDDNRRVGNVGCCVSLADLEALERSLATASTALERMADPRNIHFAGDAQALAKITLAALNDTDEQEKG